MFGESRKYNKACFIFSWCAKIHQTVVGCLSTVAMFCFFVNATLADFGYLNLINLCMVSIIL